MSITIKPGVAGYVSCSAADIVKRTGEASTQQLENFEKFMASEHIEHEEIDRNGKTGAVRARDFSYLVFIDHDKGGQIFLKESRDGGTGIDSFPTSLATVWTAGTGRRCIPPGIRECARFYVRGIGTVARQSGVAHVLSAKAKPALVSAVVGDTKTNGRNSAEGPRVGSSHDISGAARRNGFA